MSTKDELYIGMRVRIANKSAFNNGKHGTIIDLQCREDFDCLIEFDEHVNGHDGLGWGSVIGKEGYCYWYDAAELVEEITDAVEVDIETIDVSYDALFNQNTV